MPSKCWRATASSAWIFEDAHLVLVGYASLWDTPNTPDTPDTPEKPDKPDSPDSPDTDLFYF